MWSDGQTPTESPLWINSIDFGRVRVKGK